jgi:GTP-binding protein EngB required for normal cell division
MRATKDEQSEMNCCAPPVVAFVGCFQDGKSTLINCLLGQECAEVGDGDATTAVPTLYQYGKATGDDRSALGTGSVRVVSLPNEDLKRVRLLDTPGWNSRHPGHDAMTAAVLRTSLADFVVLVVPKRSPPLHSHYALLQLAAEAGLPTAVVMNSRDWKDEWDGWSESLDRVRRDFEAHLRERGHASFPVGKNGKVWPCVAAWLYPGDRFKRMVRAFHPVTDKGEQWQRQNSGILELREFVFGTNERHAFPRICSIGNICRVASLLKCGSHVASAGQAVQQGEVSC